MGEEEHNWCPFCGVKMNSVVEVLDVSSDKPEGVCVECCEMIRKANRERKGLLG